ncbi:MAG: alpha-L-fucosidase, partial [Planctomycetota bacterium]
VPDSGMPGVDWETCMTMNTTWGYSRHDHAWKSSATLIQTLVDIVSKGGNYLLNIGPLGDGSIPLESVERMEAVGRWMAVNGESIMACGAAGINKPEWGRVTKSNDQQRLYLHVFDWPADGKIELEGDLGDVTEARFLDGEAAIPFTQDDASLTLATTAERPDATVTVIRLQIAK